MLNQNIADELGKRIGERVFLYCLLNGLFLTPIVVYLSLGASVSFWMIAFQCSLLVLAVAVPMAVLNAVMTRYWMWRIPDNIAITMNPEALRSKLFLGNYLGLPLIYLPMTLAIGFLIPSASIWWSLLALGAWLFSGFVSVSAIDYELRWLSIVGYGSSRKAKSLEADVSRLVEPKYRSNKSQHREKAGRSLRL